ncbi:hypothetical protein APS_0538 [Acetobacter pasteurianus subsp. pasteurianus LMG 1262 = NBRC 106471]|nr:hypothetical protein APS_0538 [Acetobacter pasteurianus subsp. pasteurianus LMG 1262 = NBRC 106471]
MTEKPNKRPLATVGRFTLPTVFRPEPKKITPASAARGQTIKERKHQ